MRTRTSLLLLVATLPIACAPRPIPLTAGRVYAATSLGDNGGTLIPPGDPKDTLGAGSPAEQQRGILLHPGDVLHVRRWSAGNLRGSYNGASPPHAVDRVPLRRVSQSGALTDVEQSFLLNILVTNHHGQTATDQLAGELQKYEVSMWNAVVDSLRVKRIGGPVAPQNPATGVEPFRLVATVDPVRVFGQSKLLSDYLGQHPGDIDIAGISRPQPSPYHSVERIQGEDKNPGYYLTTNDLEQRLFTFVSVEIGGVDVFDPGRDESYWTLRDIQESEICFDATGSKKPLHIAAVKIKGDSHWFQFGSYDNPTHRVRRVLTGGFPEGRSRTVEAINFRWSSFNRTLSVNDLAWLTGADVTEIQWADENESTVVVPSYCSAGRGVR